MVSDKDKGFRRAVIHVTLKPGVLDPQGLAVCRSLHSLGYTEVEEVRVGKRLEISLQKANQGALTDRLEAMCRELLANPLIEEYRVELIET
ncbi:MAG: phosphoribosylformylglycinamidine synthase subunit PurS [Acidobacteriota bacterium]